MKTNQLFNRISGKISDYKYVSYSQIIISKHPLTFSLNRIFIFSLENLSSEPFCIFTSVSFFNKSYIKQDEKAVFKFDIKAEKN